jgi:hypothetical protein
VLNDVLPVCDTEKRTISMSPPSPKVVLTYFAGNRSGKVESFSVLKWLLESGKGEHGGVNVPV